MPRFLVQPCQDGHDIRQKRSLIEASSPRAAAEAVLKRPLTTEGPEHLLRARVYPEFDLETSSATVFFEPA